MVETKSNNLEDTNDTNEYADDDGQVFGAFLVPDPISFNISIPANELPTIDSNSPCKIRLFFDECYHDEYYANEYYDEDCYSDDQYFGDKIVFTENVPDISVWDFEEKLVNLRVEGDCSWEIFTGEAGLARH